MGEITLLPEESSMVGSLIFSSEWLDNSSLFEGLRVEMVETWVAGETFLKVFFVLASKSMCGNEEPLLLLWLAMRDSAHVGSPEQFPWIWYNARQIWYFSSIFVHHWLLWPQVWKHY